MEKLKSLIPDNLKRMIEESALENLTSTCSCLLDVLIPLPEFQRLIKELTDPELALCRKNKETALDFKRQGNECFSMGDYVQARSFYSLALRHSPIEAIDMGKNLAAVLYINRATTSHNAGLLEECLRDCNRAIAIMPVYAKAWYRRGKANVLLKNYGTAIQDLKVAMSLEASLSGKSQIERELEMAGNHFGSRDDTDKSTSIIEHKKKEISDVPRHIVLKCVSIPEKGRGMISMDEIHPALLVHCEEPLAAIVSKSSRETHCHFCFNEVPADAVYCPSCTIPAYCSEHCQGQAIGASTERKQDICSFWRSLSGELGKHVLDTLLIGGANSALQGINFEPIQEHRHECGGAHWSAVLPPDVVLAGRVMAKSIEKRKLSGEVSRPIENLVLAHNYLQLRPGSKLELHLYAVVLSYCLAHYYNSDYPSTGASVSQLVVAISQVKINSMAVVHMETSDKFGACKTSSMHSGAEHSFACNLEQVRVGQALYSTGSFFNHSCQPNIHAYFISRKLFLRATERVHAGDPLEISYGPQVGQWDLQDRQELLKEQYSFQCQCTACSQLNLSDLVLNAFRCAKDDCLGAVSERLHFDTLEDGTLQISDAYSSWKLSLPVYTQEISKVAYMLFKGHGSQRHIRPGCCLSCGSSVCVQSSIPCLKSATANMERLKDCIADEFSTPLVLDSLRSLGQLRLVRHQYSRSVAQAEDIIAKAFVDHGDFKAALQHCETSIQILEKLFHTRHIVIGNELIKLASVQVSLGDRAAALCSIRRIEEIFSLYYGSHAAVICPHVESLRKEVDDFHE